MTCDLIIEDGIGALRAALLEDGEVVELFWLSEDDPPVEAIYLARVTEVRPELEGAFTDLGSGLSGFLPAASLPEGVRAAQAGQRLPLQVLSDPGPDKALRVTARLRATGRYVTLSAGGAGLRPRTAAHEDPALAEGLSGVTEDHEVRLRVSPSADFREAIIAEAAQLRGRLQAALKGEGAPRQLVGPSGLLVRLLRAAPMNEGLRIHVDSRPLQAEIARLARRWPDLEGCVLYEPGDHPLYDAHGVSDVLDAVLAGAVPLPSGGYLRLAETPAATIIDVDSAGAGAGNGAATLRRATNLEASEAISRLLRLGHIGGLVVVDFLNMSAQRDRKAVETVLKSALARDPAAPQSTTLNDHGVLTITRPRGGASLRARLLEPARPVRRLDAVGHDLLARALRLAARPGGAAGTLIIAAPPAITDWMGRQNRVARLAERSGCRITLETLDDPDAAPDIRAG